MDWTPMAEKKPEKDGLYLVTLDGEICGEDKPIVGTLYFEKGEWDEDGDYVLAWRETPEPYIPPEPPMTEVEALKELSDPIVAYNPRSGLGKALNLAREALEKRIPKKIDMSREYVCPACNHKVFRSPGFQYCYYCYHCGQALEWEE